MRVKASAFDGGSDVTMQRYSLFEIIIGSSYLNFTMMQRQSPVCVCVGGGVVCVCVCVCVCGLVGRFIFF